MAAAEALDLAADMWACRRHPAGDLVRHRPRRCAGTPIPIVRMSEAGMLAAMTLARRFSLLTFGNRAVPIYEELVARTAGPEGRRACCRCRH